MTRDTESAGARISYSVEGHDDAPALLLINSIGSTREMWDRQMPELARRFRVLRYDARGHGRSSVPAGDYTIDQLAHDALAVLDAAAVARAHVCGISLGGLTAMWLGVHAPDRLKSLVLANTAARIGSLQSWTERIALVRERGMTGIAEMAIPRWISPDVREREPQTAEFFRQMIASCDPDGYLGCCAALRDADLREAIAAIRCPVLGIAGTGDAMTPPAELEAICQRVAGSRLMTFAAHHLTNVDQADGFTAAVIDFVETSDAAR
jgi:3-oxoadipate enol-lactonase